MILVQNDRDNRSRLSYRFRLSFTVESKSLIGKKKEPGRPLAKGNVTRLGNNGLELVSVVTCQYPAG